MNAKTQKILFLALFAVAIFFFTIIITVVPMFASGSGVQVRDDGMVFTHFDVTVDWNDDRSCKISEELEVEFRVSSHGIYIDIPVNSGEKVRNLEVETFPDKPCELSREAGSKIIRARVGDPNLTFRRGETLKCTVTYDYYTPKHKKGGDLLAFMPIGRGWTSDIESASVRINYPAAPTSGGEYGVDRGIWIAGDVVKESDRRVKWSNDGKTVDISVGALNAFEGVEVVYSMPGGVLKTAFETEALWAVGIGLVMIALVLVLELVVMKNKPLTPVVDYYPPRIGANGDKRHMLPVQMGKIIDDNCSADDVTSLLFYWASEGYITIDEREEGTYFTTTGKPLNEVTKYERRMYERLFSYGTTDKNGLITVSLEKLKGKFYKAIKDVQIAVSKEFGGFYTKNSMSVSLAVAVLGALFAAGFAVLTSLRVGKWLFNFYGFFTLVPVIGSYIVGTLIAKQFFKLEKRKRQMMLGFYGLGVVVLGFGLSFVIPFDVMGWFERVAFTLGLTIPSMIAPFLIVRKESYNEQLNSILGFRDFLRDAEKDRLETLLADDPQYYYNILPYANVLGVSDIWEKKFEGLTIEPPSYYRSYRGGNVIFSIYLYRSLTSDIRESVTYVPPSANSGSFSGRSGGGGGGGFSGGSFGGGGGGRW